MPSGVAAELERDRVAVLGDAAMERHSESHGPVMPRCRKVLTLDEAERVESSELCECCLCGSGSRSRHRCLLRCR